MCNQIVKDEEEEEFKRLYYIEEKTKDELAEMYDTNRRVINRTFNRFDMVKAEHDEYEFTPEHIEKVKENLPDTVQERTWDLSEEGRKAISRAMQRIHTKHGLYADIPIICHSDDCPYSETCELYQDDEEPEGEKCPIEIATIMKLTNEYASEFNVEANNTTALSLIRDLVNAEISIRRADKLISIDGNPIEEVAVGASEDGRPITRPEITKPYELKEKLLKRKHRIMSKLNATPKDKAKTEKEDDKDFSSYISKLFASMQNNSDKSSNPDVIVVNDDKEDNNEEEVN